MKKLFTILLSTICLLTVSSAYSQYYDQCVGQCVDPCVGQCNQSGNFYVGGFGGANWMNCNRIHGVKLNTKVGFTGGLSLGYAFDNGFRVEGEVSYRRNQLKDIHFKYVTLSSSDVSKLNCSFHSWSYMANFLYDFHNVSCYCPNIVPYLGIGVGYTQNHARAKDSYSNQHFKAKDNGFAVQGIAGIGYRLTDSTTLAAEYRYFVGKEKVRDHGVTLALRQAF